jgi:hypothetical protein
MADAPTTPAPASGADEIDLESALEKLTAEQFQKFQFIINEDGSVTFTDFPAELIDLAYALNPDDPLVCERRSQATAPTPDVGPASSIE